MYVDPDLFRYVRLLSWAFEVPFWSHLGAAGRELGEVLEWWVVIGARDGVTSQ